MASTRRVLIWIVGVALAGLFVLWLAPRGTESPSVAGESALERIRRVGTARVGYANEAPYAFVGADGELTGEAPEIAKQILSRLGVEGIEGVLTEFGSLIPGLQAGRFDLIAAGMYVTPERCREIAFSEPTYSIGEAFIVAAGNPLDLHGYDDIAANPEARLGVVAGTVERGYARTLGIPDDQVVVFPDPPSAIAGVAAGRVDAFAGTRLTIRDLLAKSHGDALIMATPFHEPEVGGKVLRGYGAFGFRNEDADLRDAFDRELATFIGSPEHEELVAPFGFTADELPGDVTTAELCAP